VFDLSFIPPRFSFAPSHLSYCVTLVVFVIVAVATSELVSRAHDEIECDILAVPQTANGVVKVPASRRLAQGR
jgi:K+-sensing histidine kinase KdpD